MRSKAFFLALLCLALAGTAEAQWKWRDAKGKLQYSDLPPPPGTPDKDVLQRPASAVRNIVVVPMDATSSDPASAPAPRPAASAPSKAEQEASARQKQEQDREAAKQKDEERRLAERKRENCSRAQANLRDLQSGTRLTRTNDRGERVFMEQGQIAAEVARARDVITENCR